jgi:signal transduction histidine kinase
VLNIFKNRLFDFVVLFTILLIAIVVFIISNNITQNKIEIIKKEKYNIYAKNIHDEIKTLINHKKNLTLAIALSLSKDNNIIKALKTDDIELLQLNEFSQLLKKAIKLNNSWFHIIDNKGIVFYRSWIEKRGDSLIKSRLDVARMIEDPQIMCTISTGKFDMTFKSMVPIYNKSTFIGMFEIVTHFNSISRQLRENDIDSIIVVDKKYKNQLIQPLTKIFIDDYYVANENVKDEIIDYIKNKGVENYIHSKKNYIIDTVENKFIVVYNIPDIYNKPMGSIVAFKELDSLNMNDIEYVKTNMIFYMLLFILVVILFGYYFIVKKHTKELDIKVIKRTKELYREKQYIQAILDTNPSIILVTHDSKIVSANKRFLEFFHYKTLDEFKEYYKSICDFFVTLDDIPFPKDYQIHGDLWSVYLAKYSNNEHFVTLKFEDEEYNFIVSGSYLKNKDDILLTFQNITDLKKKDKLLYEQSKMASMGEMIGNIAHQWRQPLSIISTAATGMKVQKQFGNLTDKHFNESCDTIDSNAQYLSKTIDDFRDFIKGTRKKENFKFDDVVEKLLNLIKPSLGSNYIELILDVEKDITINGYLNELVQCLINIFNNAKDAVKIIDEKDRVISLEAKVISENLSIVVKDSGGGIDPAIIDKIFDPYFTTKHQSVGTGLGLHMTYNLIVDGMHGSIDAHNCNFKHNSKNYKGAMFSISLPLE